MKTLVALVGMKHRGSEALVASLPQGEPLNLVRDRDNKFDPWAVQVWARGQHVGFIKATQVKPIAMAMDKIANTAPTPRESPPYAKPAKLAIDGGKWPMVEIDE